MKTCDNCKRVFEDDMSFCPYCGEKYHDYKDDIENAMENLMEDETEKTIPVTNSKSEKPLSRISRQNELHRQKEDALLNKLILVLIVALIAVLLAGGYYLAKIFLSKNHTSTIPPIVEENKEENHSETQNPEKEIEVLPPSEEIKLEGQGNLKVQITSFDVSKQEDMARIDVKCESDVEGEIFLSDHEKLNVGPIRLRKGKSSFYFLINPSLDKKYMITFYNTDKSDHFEYTFTGEQIIKALEE